MAGIKMESNNQEAKSNNQGLLQMTDQAAW